MEVRLFFLVIAVIMIVLIPIAPRMIRLRIAVPEAKMERSS